MPELQSASLATTSQSTCKVSASERDKTCINGTHLSVREVLDDCSDDLLVACAELAEGTHVAVFGAECESFCLGVSF